MIVLINKSYKLTMKKYTQQPAKPDHKGVMRNDLPGYMKLKGNRIYVRWKGKDIATGFKNTGLGWKMANEFWAKRSKELQSIEDGEKPVEDTIGNIFKKFLEHKNKIDKIAKRTEQRYITGFRAVFVRPNELLSENNVKNQIAEFITTTKISPLSINNYLVAANIFLNWASDDDNNYIPAKKYIKKYKQKVVEKVKPPYTQEEYNLLLSYFQHKNKEMYIFLQFLWNTGARCGEALTIKLNDLDLLNNRILVPNKIYKGKQELLLLTPKAVRITEQAQELAILRGNNKLFSWKEIKYPNGIIIRAERKLEMKIEGRGLHGFRRSFSNRLFKQKLTIPDVQDIMRHKNIKTTIEHYREFYPELLIEEMSKKL
jgi:integrase